MQDPKIGIQHNAYVSCFPPWLARRISRMNFLQRPFFKKYIFRNKSNYITKKEKSAWQPFTLCFVYIYATPGIDSFQPTPKLHIICTFTLCHPQEEGYHIIPRHIAQHIQETNEWIIQSNPQNCHWQQPICITKKSLSCRKENFQMHRHWLLFCITFHLTHHVSKIINYCSCFIYSLYSFLKHRYIIQGYIS